MIYRFKEAPLKDMVKTHGQSDRFFGGDKFNSTLYQNSNVTLVDFHVALLNRVVSQLLVDLPS